MRRKDEIAERRSNLSPSKQSILGKLLGGEFAEDARSVPQSSQAARAVKTAAPASPEPGGAPATASQFRHRLPNGLEIVCHSKVEADHFYEDIFVDETYVKHGITIKDGDCVFDVGANIGLFTLFAHYRRKGVRVFAFEPAPPVFEMLRINSTLHNVNARLFNFGLSDKSRKSTLTFYPNSSAMSSFYANEADEKEVLKSIMLNQLQSGVEGIAELIEYSDDLFQERFKSESFDCELRTLSEVIEENNIGRIDLLKIDVQKSEKDVLAGIGQSDWEKIGQIVAEVHNLAGRLDEVSEFLKSKDYTVTVKQDPLFKGSALYNIYATRRGER